MERVKGLTEYIRCARYREAMGLPKEVKETYQLLAQGEYNINFIFTHPVTRKQLLLRVNCGSQMHLPDQIEYEAKALQMLENSGHTPKVLYVDGSLQMLNHGVLVMEYLPGHELCYEMELLRAAKILADIHSVPVPQEHHLIIPEDPLRAILEECEAMVKTYMDSDLGEDSVKFRLRRMLDLGWESVKKQEVDSGKRYQCVVNTELNSTNFLIGGEVDYLIDWEKPVHAEPAQDLGHFLAPTTTFWKTDVILTREETDKFLAEYIRQVDGRFPVEGVVERTKLFIPITCLRGLTWCAMAWIEYQNPDKLIFNASTYEKLQAYLSDAFLGKIERLWNITGEIKE